PRRPTGPASPDPSAGRFRLVPVMANGQSAFVVYRVNATGPTMNFQLSSIPLTGKSQTVASYWRGSSREARADDQENKDDRVGGCRRSGTRGWGCRDRLCAGRRLTHADAVSAQRAGTPWRASWARRAPLGQGVARTDRAR